MLLTEVMKTGTMLCSAGGSGTWHGESPTPSARSPCACILHKHIRDQATCPTPSYFQCMYLNLLPSFKLSAGSLLFVFPFCIMKVLTGFFLRQATAQLLCAGEVLPSPLLAVATEPHDLLTCWCAVCVQCMPSDLVTVSLLPTWVWQSLGLVTPVPGRASVVCSSTSWLLKHQSDTLILNRLCWSVILKILTWHFATHCIEIKFTDIPLNLVVQLFPQQGPILAFYCT